jgi:UDP-N-acetylmuramoylalanine--D-glutamate ligase
MGLGLFDGGLGVTRYLVARGDRVTVTDVKTADDLAPSIEKLSDLDVRLVLGGHEERDFRETDLVVVNPAVPPGNPFVRAAVDSGVRISTEIAVFAEACPAPIVGVTGTAGKSTTTSLLERCLAASGRRAHLGGNIGKSLLASLPEIAPDDVVVLELSSFHLHWLRRTGWRPWIGVFSNLAANHLDWHRTLEDYAADKAGILPAADGVFVSNHDDPHVRRLAESATCSVVWTARDSVPEGDAVFWRGADLVRREGSEETHLLSRDDVRLLGEHALWNVAQAAAGALAAGATPDGIREAVRGFGGLRHRLNPLREVQGVLCVDDSKSTTPGATALALAAFERPVLLLAGGYDKQLDATVLTDAAAARAKGVICYGQTGPALAAALRAAGCARVVETETLAEAVSAAFEHATEGDVLLLSPGHASWDQFANYEARSAAFAGALECANS